MKKFIAPIAGVLGATGAVAFVVGVCGLFVTSDTRVKPETRDMMVSVSNSLGAYGMVASFLAGSIIMAPKFKPQRKKQSHSEPEIIAFTPKSDRLAS